VTDERLSLFAKFFTEKRGAVGDSIALDHNEAVIDLIEPRRVGQGVMEIGFGISRRELPNSPGHLNRDFVSNQMEVFAARLIGNNLGEEGDTLLAGVTSRRSPYHSPLRMLGAA
jgi:hypothetical protein